MTPDDVVYNTISDATRVPGARMTWGGPNCTPDLPYFVYGRRSGGDFFADDGNHAALPRYRVTLYTEEHDEELEESFARAVSELGAYSRSWEYDDEHEAFVFHLDFTLTRRAG